MCIRDRPWLPDITPWLDPLKGIEPHRDTEAYLKAYTALDRALQQNGPRTAESNDLLQHQVVLTTALMDSNPFISSGQAAPMKNSRTDCALAPAWNQPVTPPTFS